MISPPIAARGTTSVAIAGAVVAAVLVSASCLFVPTDLLEALVVRSGMAALVNAAAPPLGFTARAVLAMTGGALTAAVTWALLVLLAGERRVTLARPRLALPTRAFRPGPGEGGPSVRRADSHPDAPPRPPILAERDLGAPFLSVVAPAAAPASPDLPIPRDLDTALAAIDPAAIPAVPREPVRPVPSLAPPAPSRAAPLASSRAVPLALSRVVPLAPGERIDAIELSAGPHGQPDSIETLLARLERGARRRPVPVAGAPSPAAPTPVEPEPARVGSLEETLGSLRRLAARR